MNHERIFPTDRHGNPIGPAVEEVVRCRDCKYAFAFGNGCTWWGDGIDTEVDGFCKFGERRDSNGN